MKGFLTAAVLLLLVLQACGSAGPETLAVVNSKIITKGEFKQKTALYGLEVSKQEDAKGFLNLLINDYIILEQARRDGMKVSKEELAEEIGAFIPGFSEREIRKSLKKKNIKYSYWLRDIEEKIVRKKEIIYVMKNRIKIEENDLKDYFWTNILEFRTQKRIMARQIVLDDEQKAREVARLARDGDDFAGLAKKYSITSESEAGGDLGAFSPGDMPDFINAAVAGLKKGDISTIVKSSYGWHIFKVDDIIEAQTPNFEESREKVIERYFEMKKDEYFGVWMEELRKKTDIKVNEENLKKFVEEVKK